MKKFLKILLNVVVFTFIGIVGYNYYVSELDSVITVDCSYDYIISNNEMTFSCDVNDNDLIISDDYPLTLTLYDENSVIIVEENLVDGTNVVDIDTLDFNAQYSISIVGFNFISEKFVATNLGEYDFSTVREVMNIPTWEITEAILLDTEYYFSLSILDDDDCVESVDVILYNSSDSEIYTKNFIGNDDVSVLFEGLNPESEYDIEININYIINDYNELHELLVPIDITTSPILLEPTATMNDVINNNVTLSFDLSANNNDATDVAYTIKLIDMDDNVLYEEIATVTNVSIDVTGLDENYIVLVTSSYVFKGVSVEKELDTYNVYVNTLSNFFVLSTLHVVNTDDPITNYDDYDDYIFTYINQGITDFSIICESPIICSELVENPLYATIPLDIAGFVHSYFDTSSINYSYSDSQVAIVINHEYTSAEVLQIDQAATQILNEIIIESMTEFEKIEAVHNYVINNTVYDTVCAENVLTCDNDHNALGVFVDGNAVCDGYSGAIDVLLRTLGIPTFKINSITHQWNAVYYNNGWYHLDATWDDPVTNNGTNILNDDYLLISSAQLASLDDTDAHIYSTTYIDFME